METWPQKALTCCYVNGDEGMLLQAGCKLKSELRDVQGALHHHPPLIPTCRVSWDQGAKDAADEVRALLCSRKGEVESQVGLKHMVLPLVPCSGLRRQQ